MVWWNTLYLLLVHTCTIGMQHDIKIHINSHQFTSFHINSQFQSFPLLFLCSFLTGLLCQLKKSHLSSFVNAQVLVRLGSLAGWKMVNQ